MEDIKTDDISVTNGIDNIDLETLDNLTQTQYVNTKIKIAPRKVLVGEKPVRNSEHKCDQCESSFYNGSTLARHIKSRHDGVRYDCGQCDHSFTDKCDFAKTQVIST